MSSGYYVQAGPVTVKINGVTVLNTTSRFSMHGGGGYSKSGTITVAHNTDGTKSVAMSVRAAIYSASVNCTTSKTFTLNKIDRYALLGAVENFNDEGNPTIEYTNPAGTDLVTGLKVRLVWNNGADYTAWNALNDAGGTFTFSLSASDRSDLLLASASSNTLPVQFDLASTLGGVEYHDKKNATMTVINANPTAGAVSFSDVNPTSSGITGDPSIIVQAQSTLQIVTATSTATKQASIVSYSLNFNGTDTDITADKYLNIVKPGYSGTFTATVTTTDSRGNTATASTSVTIVPWEMPYADCTLERVNAFETSTILTVDGTISTVTGSTMSLTESHREVGGAWSTPQSIPDAPSTTTLTLANTKEWEVLVSIWDTFTSGTPVTYTLTAGKGIPIAFVDIDQSSVGVHGVPDDTNQLYVGGTAKLKPNDTDAGVILPHTFDTSEQVVGYWIDGRPIYEITVDLGTTVSLAANTNTEIMNWATPVQPLEFFAFRRSSPPVAWQFIGATIQNSKLYGISPRDTAATIDGFTMRYFYI